MLTIIYNQAQQGDNNSDPDTHRLIIDSRLRKMYKHLR